MLSPIKTHDKKTQTRFSENTMILASLKIPDIARKAIKLWNSVRLIVFGQ